MAEQRLAKLREVMDYFEITKASEFQREWKEVPEDDRIEIRELVAIENDK